MNKVLIRLVFSGVLMAGAVYAAISPASAWSCSLSDITITQANIVHKSESLISTKVVGELLNKCGDPIGVELHTTLRDRAGTVVSTDDSWPASVHNIPPGQPYGFTITVDEPRPADKLEVDVIEVHKWR